MADLKQCGTTPVEIEVLIMSVINGRSLFRHRVKRKPGRGSSSQVLMGCFVIMLLTKGMVTG